MFGCVLNSSNQFLKDIYDKNRCIAFMALETIPLQRDSAELQ